LFFEFHTHSGSFLCNTIDVGALHGPSHSTEPSHTVEVGTVIDISPSSVLRSIFWCDAVAFISAVTFTPIFTVTSFKVSYFNDILTFVT